MEAQKSCGDKGLAGTFYFHESMLVKPLAFALIKDAPTNEGLGLISRIYSQLDTICKPYLTPRLNLDDLLITESSNLVFLFTIPGYSKAAREPEIMSYAGSGARRSC